jgi:hypothetical protein
MSSIEPEKVPFPKPVELRLANAFYVRLNMKKNHILFKDLSEKGVHYSVFQYGTTFDFHKTLEAESNPLKRHPVQIKRELDLRLLTERIAQDLCADRNALVRVARTDSSEWKDIDLKFIPIAGLKELFSDVVKGNKWTFGVDFFDNFESAFHYTELGKLAVGSPVMGWSSEGHFTFSSGKDCVLFNTSVLSESIEKNLQLLSDSGRH